MGSCLMSNGVVERTVSEVVLSTMSVGVLSQEVGVRGDVGVCVVR
jgi:bacterioferritin-associated ferredoxin